MRQLFCALLIAAYPSIAFAQTKANSSRSPKRPTTPQSASTSAQSSQVRPQYLKSPLDLTANNVGANFFGHDIAAIFQAVKSSPSLQEKSEFESTAVFQARRAAFVSQPLFASLLPTAHLAFIVAEGSTFAPRFRYDADSQTLSLLLTATSEQFILDKHRPTLDTILVQRVVRDSGTYVGTNAFGAKVEVRKTFAEEYGIAFEQHSWIFPRSGGYERAFSYVMAMEPDQARTLKVDAGLLLICRLEEPWIRSTAHGHEATISEPYETLVGDNYLQVIPEEIWIFNKKTGDVIAKLSAASIGNERDHQLSLRLRETPVILEVSSDVGHQLYRVRVDDQEQESGIIEESKTFAARRRIVLTLEYPHDLSSVHVKLNGKPYFPNWTKDGTRIGSYESIRSVTVEVTAPPK
jgi:hypothetical protein